MGIPSLGLGTFRLKGDAAYQAVSTGLRLGYRHIDTAQIYDNEADVGRAITDAALPRDQLFVTTKIWTEHLAPGKLVPSLQQSLAKLGLDQVDLTLIHWPSPQDAEPVAQYLAQLQDAKTQGLTQAVGVSNFTLRHLKEALAAVGPGLIATNQVEMHPFLQNRALLDFCRAQGIRVTAYMPLAYGKVMADDTLKAIGAKHQVSAASVALAWLLAQDIVVIPSSTQEAHQLSNLKAKELVLDADDMARIAGLDQNERLVAPDFGPAWD